LQLLLSLKLLVAIDVVFEDGAAFLLSEAARAIVDFKLLAPVDVFEAATAVVVIFEAATFRPNS
jgi:hypothetical protein